MWLYTYLRDRGKWEVGFFKPNGEWHGISEHFVETDAMNKVHYLNGGNKEGQY